jgi:hypothetical protein
MKTSISWLFFAAFLFVGLLPLPCLAELTADSLEKLARDAGVFDATDELKVAVSGSDVGVNAYMSAESKDAITDAKINTVLLARRVMEKEPGVARVTTRFYDKKTGDYYEVVITSEQVKSFASGAVSQDQLLAALKLQHHSSDESDTASAPAKTEVAVAPPVAASGDGSTKASATGEQSPSVTSEKQPDKSKTDVSSTTDKSSKQEKPKQREAAVVKPMATYTGYGMSFDYPSSFRRRPSDPSVKYILSSWDMDLLGTGGRYIAIEFQILTEGKTVEQWVKKLQEHHSTFPGYHMVQSPTVITFGPQKISGIREIFSYKQHQHQGSRPDNESLTEIGHYEHDIYFGWPDRVYNIKMYCYGEDYKHATQVFEGILHTLRVVASK